MLCTRSPACVRFFYSLQDCRPDSGIADVMSLQLASDDMTRIKNRTQITRQILTTNVCLVLPGLLAATLVTAHVWIGALFITNVVITAMYLLYAMMNNTEIALTMFPTLDETAPSIDSKTTVDALGEFPETTRSTKEIIESLKLTINRNVK